MRIVLSDTDCHRAAAILELAYPTSPSPQMHLCADSLREIAALGPAYSQGVRITYPFLVDAQEMIRALCEMGSYSAEEVRCIVFALYECFAMIAREHAINKGMRCVSAVQAEVMRCFEADKDWNPDDETLAAYYYYWLIPGVEKDGEHLGARRWL